MIQLNGDTKQRLFRSIILLLCLSALLLTCLRVIGLGFSPNDDALRHVAKVVSGKSWFEVLVVRPEITMDSHPGWHTILSTFHNITGCEKQILLNFSVLFLFLVFTIPPVFYFRRCEAWIAALALSSCIFFLTIFRLFYGRPFIISMVIVVLFCFLCSRIRYKSNPILELLVLSFGVALAVWIHGTWYLFILPIIAIMIARWWRVFFLVSVSIFVGIILGASLTGKPLVYLQQMFFHAVEAFGKYDFQRQLVGEFQPFTGEIFVLFVIGALLVWRWIRNEWDNQVIDNPIFYMVIISWIAGFIAVRFWLDWAWPALAYWIAIEIQAILEFYTRHFSAKRIIIVGVLCLVMILSITNDSAGRWSGLPLEWPSMDNASHRSWLPDEGGVLYNDDMFLFYHVFYANPHGPWRYVLGFEPIWMSKENLAVFRNIQLTRGNNDSYIPWVKTMTEKDRLIIKRGAKPSIEDLEWHEVTTNIWAGKKINSKLKKE